MKKQELAHKTTAYFQNYFGKLPDATILSPGRINIIGEHVDYNHGFVLPAAIDKYICIVISKNKNKNCSLIAIDLEDEYHFDIDSKIEPVSKTWVNYFLGVLHQLKEQISEGFDLVFSSTIPIGAGLSSSAALECGFTFALNHIYKLGLDQEKIAKIGQKAEHTFVGVQCGIMDQFASVFGKENQVIKLDCDTLEHQYFPADFQQYALLLLNTNVKHSLQFSQYNNRRKEVEEGLRIIKSKFTEVKTFRDCTPEMMISLKNDIDQITYKRSFFVINEIQRVKKAVEALVQKDFKKLGELMTETHLGLSKDYEVSCEELDFLAENMLTEKTVLGARMMGGGFGGCTINLIEKSAENEVIEKISKKYLEKFGIELSAYQVELSDGTSLFIDEL